MANNKNEELQSRRDFFKKAGKGILPVLGLMMLSNIPTILNAAEKTPSGCDTNCQNGCAQDCFTGCEGKCADHCAHSCSENCVGSCRGRCINGCQGGCKFTCRNQVEYN